MNKKYSLNEGFVVIYGINSKITVIINFPSLKMIKLKNDSDEVSEFSISFISTNYPVKSVAEIVTDDLELNTVLDVCRHTLKICRQLHHLDSPRHCEPLACTGDYYIETLMTLFSFGDMSLAETNECTGLFQFVSTTNPEYYGKFKSISITEEAEQNSIMENQEMTDIDIVIGKIVDNLGVSDNTLNNIN